MATGDKRINIEFNRLLDRTSLRENWLTFFDDKLAETVSAMFQGQSGTLDSEDVGLQTSLANTFDLDMTHANKLVVGDGQVVTLPTNAGRVIKEHKEVPFENTAAQVYEIGIRYQQVPDGVQLNGITGRPEYPRLREAMGEYGDPDSVVDTSGVKISLNVNALTESGVDYSGRKVIVLLTIPKSGAEAIAYYEGVIAYSSPNNTIDVPYSGANGPLGQDTSVNPPSTLASDYKVHIPGASWKKGAASIFGDSAYAFIGKATGGTPPVLDVSDQSPIFLISLQTAYDGSGSGAGRSILVKDGSVELKSGPSDVGDRHQSILRLDKLTDTEAGGVCVEALTHLERQQGVMSLHLLHSGSGITHPSNIGTLLFTDSTDLDAEGYNNTTDLVIVSGTPTSDGLYRAAGVVQAGPSPVAEIAVLQLDGTGASIGEWDVDETCTIHLVRPVLQAGGGVTAPGPVGNAGTRGNVSAVAKGSHAAISVHPGNSGRCLDVLAGGGADNTTSKLVSGFNGDGYLEVYDSSGVLRSRYEDTLGRLVQRLIRFKDIATAGGQEFDLSVEAGAIAQSLVVDNVSGSRNKILEIRNEDATEFRLAMNPRGTGNALQYLDELEILFGEGSADSATIKFVKSSSTAKNFQIVIGTYDGGYVGFTITPAGASITLGAKASLSQWLNLEAIKAEHPDSSEEWIFASSGTFPSSYVIGYRANNDTGTKILRLLSNDLPVGAIIDSIDVDWYHQGTTLGQVRILKYRWIGSTVSVVELNSSSNVLTPSNGASSRGIDQFTVNQNANYNPTIDKLFFEVKSSGDTGLVDTWLYGIRVNYHTSSGIGTKYY